MFLFWVNAIYYSLLIYLVELVSPESYIFWIAMMAGSFQLRSSVYGPTFATVQELAPAHMKATVIAFFILKFKL